MFSQIISNWNMDENFESDWFPIKIEPMQNFGKRETAESLQITWEQVQGSPNGKLFILVSIDAENSTVARSIEINTSDNINDAEVIFINPLFSYIKLKYNKNGISGGFLNAIIYYGS